MRFPGTLFAGILMSVVLVVAGLSCFDESDSASAPKIAPSQVETATVDATVIDIVDGDTLIARTKDDEFTVDLLGVDCPEIGQRFGRHAGRYMDVNLKGQPIRLYIQPNKTDNVIRGRVFDSEDGDVQLRLLSLGLAWTAQYDFPDKQRYQREQEIAKSKLTGLWADPGYVPPWEFTGSPNNLGVDGLPGRWRIANPSTTQTSAELAEALNAIGYLSGHDAATDTDGVIQYLKERAQPGLNLIVSGHGHEATIVDMQGAVVHRWRYPWKRVMPEWEHQIRSYVHGHEFWRRVQVYPNGDLLAIYDNLGLAKIDNESNLIWAYVGTCHHDLDIDKEGHIFVLTRTLQSIETIAEMGKVSNDSITELTPDGELVRKINVVDCFMNSRFRGELKKLKLTFDPMHVNSIQLVYGDEGIFRDGRVLISIRELDLLAVIDLEIEQVVWTLSGPWLRQHDPQLLDNGHILLFDNLGHHGHSRVLEIEPSSGKVVWSYAPSDPKSFYTPDCGLSHRLDNGNTLTIESNRGRALEIDRAGNIVWEYKNPNRAGEQRELVATLFDVIRLPSGYASGWANGGVIPTP